MATIYKITLPNGDSYDVEDKSFTNSSAHGISSDDITNWNSKTSNTGTVTKVTAGTGLSIGTTAGGNFTTSGTINHTNSVTAQTTQAIYPIKIDAQGHISAYGTAVTPLTASSTLDATKLSGTVPTASLPSYVDDVLEYNAKSSFPATGENGKIYVDTGTNLTYRWSGSAYVEISPSLALGTTSSTAFRGDYGNSAYTHAVTNKGSAFSSGLYKITTNSEGHVTAATAVAKADITGLGIPAQDTTYTFDGTYNASTNKAATVSTVTNALIDTTLTGNTVAESVNTDELISGSLIVNGDARFVNPINGDLTGDVTGNVVGNVSGSAGTAGAFTSAKSVTLTGDVTGSASSTGGWSVATTVVDDSHNHTADTIMVPKMTKSYTGLIGTENNASNGSFYFIKVVPDTFNGNWYIDYKLTCTMNGISDANGGGRQNCHVKIYGMRNTYSGYDIWNSISNTSYRSIYYHNIYRAKSAGISYGHAIGVGFRNAYDSTNSTYARNITVEVLDYQGCTVSLLDTAVKYANWTGTGSTNYDGLSELDAYTNGRRMTGDNNDTTTLQYSTSRLTAGTNGLPGYSVVMMKPNETWEGITVGNATTDTTSTKNTSGFVLGQMYWYQSGTNIASGSITGTSTIRTSQDWADFRYTSNCGSTLTSNKMIYLKGTVTNGLFYLADTWWTQDLPTTDDGFIYIPIGMAYSTYQFDFWGWHGAYYHNGTTIVEYHIDSDSIFVVTVTSTTTNGTTTYSADKTFAEITAAYNAGKLCICKYSGYVYQLSEIFSASVKFSLLTNSSSSTSAETSNTRSIFIDNIDNSDVVTINNSILFTNKGTRNIYSYKEQIAKVNATNYTIANLNKGIVDYNTTTATQAYSTGDLFWLNYNVLVKATTNIASGATLTENTNYVKTTIADELKSVGGGSSTLVGLTDTTITSPTNGQVLMYNSTTSKWENTSLPIYNGGVSS